MHRGAVRAAALLVAGSGLVAGCGNSGAGARAPAVVRPACHNTEVSLRVADTVDLARCGPGTYADVASGTALRKKSPVSFVAVRTGTAVVEVSTGPVCSPGAVCSDLRIQRARIQVTVR